MIDFHSHSPDAIIRSLTPAQYRELEASAPVQSTRRLMTVGIHPWDSAEVSEADLATIERALSNPAVVALGEAGLDPLRGAPLDCQLEVFARQLSLAARKPVVAHIVRRYDLLLGLHKKFDPRQPLAVHGFRGKRATAVQLADRGIYMSLGERFNPEAAAVIPAELLLIETDDADSASIYRTAQAVAAARSCHVDDLVALTDANARRFFGLPIV